jgi:hypothetical protein
VVPLALLAVGIVTLGADPVFAVKQANPAVDFRTAGQGAAKPAAVQEQEDHGLPQQAVEIGRPFGFPITNSMVVSWIVALCLIVFARSLRGI